MHLGFLQQVNSAASDDEKAELMQLKVVTPPFDAVRYGNSKAVKGRRSEFLTQPLAHGLRGTRTQHQHARPRTRRLT